MGVFSLYWHTLRHLRPVQFYGRAWFLLYRPRPDLSPPPPRRTFCSEFVKSCCRAPSLLGPDRILLLGQERVVGDAAHWNDRSRDKLWLYHLHYFDDLNARSATSRTSWHESLVERWIVENPPGRGVGWEPYPTSLRVVNWIKWALGGHRLSAAALLSLVVQARWLRRRLEYHLLGNHLLANAKALIFAGLFFTGDEASRWYDKGMALLARELTEQVLADGGHFERSPMYHQIVLEDLLDLINLHKACGQEYPLQWHEMAGRMLEWSHFMRHPDGEISFFNDAAFGVAPTPGQNDAYAGRLGIVRFGEGFSSLHHLEASGYARLEAGSAVLLTDMAPVGPDYLPGHAHADTLSFEFSLGVRRLVVNGGISLYVDGDERLRQRSTLAHATVVVDGKNSSEVWGGFRVARRARIIEAKVWCEGESCWAAATHDGYRHLSGSPVHRRTWSLTAGELHVADELFGEGKHQVEIVFPLAPGLLPEVKKGNCVLFVDEESGTRVCVLQADGGAKIVTEHIVWHPRFGEAVGAWRVRLILQGSFPLSHLTVLRWGDL